MIKTEVVTATDSAEPIHRESGNAQSVAISNPGPEIVLIGGEDLDESNGWPVAPGAPLSVDVPPGDVVYVLNTGTDQDINVLAVGH